MIIDWISEDVIRGASSNPSKWLITIKGQTGWVRGDSIKRADAVGDLDQAEPCESSSLLAFCLVLRPETCAVRNIPVVRDPDWSLDHKGGPAMKEARGIHQESGYELHIRGEVLSQVEAWEDCQSFGIFRSCVLGHEYRHLPFLAIIDM